MLDETRVSKGRAMDEPSEYVICETIEASGREAVVTVWKFANSFVATWKCSCGAREERSFGHHILARAIEVAKEDCLDHCKPCHL